MTVSTVISQDTPVKYFITVAIVPFMVWVSSASAKDFPKWVYKITQLEEAQAKAAEENKGLAFVLTEENSSCSICVAATSATFTNLKRHSVIVHIPSNEGDRFELVYPTVSSGFNAPGMSNTIPKVIITSPDMMTVWKILDYPDLQKDRTFSDVSKTITAICAGTATPELAKDAVLYWYLPSSSRKYIGSFEKIDDKGRVVLKLSGGFQAFTEKELCAGAINYARNLAGKTSENSDSVEAIAFKEEKWTSSDGKTLVATFVSLIDGKITLRKTTGKDSTFSIKRLSQESRKRAEELAGGDAG